MSIWSDPLPFPIAPKSGPMRRMETLSHMNKALTKDLPFRQLCQPRWQHAARLVVLAAERGLAEDIQLACEAVVEALDHEGVDDGRAGAASPQSFQRPSGLSVQHLGQFRRGVACVH
jgi:hypothetical protein